VAPTSVRDTPDAAYLERAIARYAPEVAATGRLALRALRARFPGARVPVYERRRLLAIGFAPADRGSPIFSLVLYPRWVRFFFLEGVGLDDPEGRLEGDGRQVRSIRLDDEAAILDDPYVTGLMRKAQALANADLRKGKGDVVFKMRLETTAKPATRPHAVSKRSHAPGLGRRTLDFDAVRALGLNLAGAEESTAYGSPALKVGGQMFACIAVHRSAEPNTLVVRMSFDQRDALIADAPETYYLTDHYVGHPCVLVRLSRVRKEAVGDLLQAGWRFVSAQRKPARRRTKR